MPKSRFLLVTPTFGRKELRRCIDLMEHQMFRDFNHLVIGDGPQSMDVRKSCEGRNVTYRETAVKDPPRCYGAGPRNFALELLENGVLDCDYVIFLDDDNVLLEPALYQAHWAAHNAGNPPLLYQDIVFTNGYKEEYYIMPKTPTVPVQGDWDQLNGIFRKDILLGLRFKTGYTVDVQFAKDAMAKVPGVPFVKVRGIGGIHHLSWDTFPVEAGGKSA